jgi:hypothetical protein
VTLGAIANEGEGVVLEVILGQILAKVLIVAKFGTIEAVVDLQEASPLASRHALFAIVSSRSITLWNFYLHCNKHGSHSP